MSVTRAAPPRSYPAMSLNGQPTMREGTARRRRAIFEEAAAIVQRDYANGLELDAVARRVATSRRQLQRVFAEFGGLSFRAYLAAVRMQQAERLLRESALPVGEVALRVGYRQPAQFAKAFRRHRGVTPSGVRSAARATSG